MSVRKLALAALQRVDSLRQSLVDSPTPMIRGIALSAGILFVSGPASARAEFADRMPPGGDPMLLDAGQQWFEPLYDADILDMKPKKRAHTGWYGTADYMSLWATRPSDAPGNWLMDNGGGFRIDLGYMNDEDVGYSFTYMDYSVHQYDGYNRERLNRFNLYDENGIQQDVPLGPPWGWPQVPQDGNNFGYMSRFVEMRDSENVADFKSFEANKTWRLEPYHYGGILEPLVGLRYMRFTDVYQRMQYDADLFFPPVFDPLDPTFVAGEQVLTEQSVTTNDMIGGQIGFRYFKFAHRWRYSAELKAFNAASFQSNRWQTSSELTLYEGTEAEPQAVINNYIVEKGEPIYGKNVEFAWGLDVRSEISYTLTKMIEVRGGLQVMHIGDGIWRGRLIDQIQDQDQMAIMAGLTFGVALNR